jgi:hypothetical protein
MDDEPERRDRPEAQGRAARVPSRQPRIARARRATIRRVTVGVALTAAAAISGITGLLAGTATDAGLVTAIDGRSTSTVQSGQSGTDDWGSASSPGSAGGLSGHTSTSGS